MNRFNAFFVVILVVYGYLNVLPHALPYQTTTFCEYVSRSGCLSSNSPSDSLSHGSNTTDTYTRDESQMTPSSPSQASFNERTSEMDAAKKDHSEKLEMELFQKDTSVNSEATLPAPTMQVQVPKQSATNKLAAEYKGVLKLPHSRSKKKYYFNPPPLGKTTRFQSESNRLTPGTRHIADVAEIFNRTLQWEDKSITPGMVISTDRMAMWFPSWKNRLRVNCNDNRNFALCQVHAVVSWDSSTHAFRAYEVQPYKEVESSRDVDFTYCMVSSVDRLFYMPFLARRWKGHFSLALIVSESELNQVDLFLMQFANLQHFRVTIYVVLDDAPKNYVVYTRDPTRKRQTARRIFPINLLRDYALNNAVTSHVMLLDMDLWPSPTLYHNLKKVEFSVLESKRSVLMLPTFSFSLSTVKYVQRVTRNAMHVDRLIPNSKEKLKECVMQARCILFLNAKAHKIVRLGDYFGSDYPVYKLSCMNYTDMEPYMVLRRNELMPIYHPYFVDYGRNKMELTLRLRFEGYSFYVILSDFGFDYPHPKSMVSHEFLNMRARGVALPTVDLYKVIDRYVATSPNKGWSFPVCSSRRY